MTSTPTRPVDNVVIATKGLQDKNTNIIAGTTVENKGKLILNTIQYNIYLLILKFCCCDSEVYPENQSNSSQ